MNLGKVPVLKHSFTFMSFMLRCDSTCHIMPWTICVHVFLATDLGVPWHKSGAVQQTVDTSLVLEMYTTKLLSFCFCL